MHGRQRCLVDLQLFRGETDRLLRRKRERWVAVFTFIFAKRVMIRFYVFGAIRKTERRIGKHITASDFV